MTIKSHKLKLSSHEELQISLFLVLSVRCLIWGKKNPLFYHSVTSGTRSAWPDAIGGNWNSHLTVLLGQWCVCCFGLHHDFIHMYLCTDTNTHTDMDILDRWTSLKQYHSQRVWAHTLWSLTHISTNPRQRIRCLLSPLCLSIASMFKCVCCYL